MPFPTVESPNSHAYETMVPSVSYEAEALNVTGEPGLVAAGFTTKSATGGCGPGDAGWTTRSRYLVPVNPSLSVTLSVTLYVPGAGYGWVVMTPVPIVESPKSQRYATIVPSRSSEADASKLTFAPTVAGFGAAVNVAIGGARTVRFR